MVANKLSVIPNKTQYLIFNPKHFNNPNCSINIDSNIISPNDSAKNLGVIFQSDMSIDNITNAIRFASTYISFRKKLKNLFI